MSALWPFTGALGQPPNSRPGNANTSTSASTTIVLILIQRALTDEVRTGKAIYHGRAGHLLLKFGHPILRTRIISPMESGVQMIQEPLKYNPNVMIADIEKVDVATHTRECGESQHRLA